MKAEARSSPNPVSSGTAYSSSGGAVDAGREQSAFSVIGDTNYHPRRIIISSMANNPRGAVARLTNDDDVVCALAASASSSTNAAPSPAALGPVLDCCAPFSAVANVQLRQMSHF